MDVNADKFEKVPPRRVSLHDAPGKVDTTIKHVVEEVVRAVRAMWLHCISPRAQSTQKRHPLVQHPFAVSHEQVRSRDVDSDATNPRFSMVISHPPLPATPHSCRSSRNAIGWADNQHTSGIPWRDRGTCIDLSVDYTFLDRTPFTV